MCKIKSIRGEKRAWDMDKTIHIRQSVREKNVNRRVDVHKEAVTSEWQLINIINMDRGVYVWLSNTDRLNAWGWVGLWEEDGGSPEDLGLEGLVARLVPRGQSPSESLDLKDHDFAREKWADILTYQRTEVRANEQSNLQRSLSAFIERKQERAKKPMNCFEISVFAQSFSSSVHLCKGNLWTSSVLCLAAVQSSSSCRGTLSNSKLASKIIGLISFSFSYWLMKDLPIRACCHEIHLIKNLLRRTCRLQAYLSRD